MVREFDYADMTPADPRNPFCNPTEEPDYSPDYREIMPELDMPDCKLPLFPAAAERNTIRRSYSIIFLMLLFGFIVSASIYTAGRLILTVVLKQIDLRAGTDIPQNYILIAEQFFSDSSISAALTCIAYLTGNLLTFRLGSRVMRTPVQEYFHARGVTPPRVVFYIILALWIQLLTGYASEWLMKLCARAGFALYAPSAALNSSLHRTVLMGLYACVIAPVTEELLLRGYVLKNACRVSQRTGIFLSAFLFAVMHENVPQFLYAFPLGILLAYITIQHNSVLPAIIVHMTVNTLTFAQTVLQTLVPLGTWRTAEMITAMTVFLLGTVAFVYLVLTERLPMKTPHQSIRGVRVIASSPLLWAFLTVHLLSALLTAGKI